MPKLTRGAQKQLGKLPRQLSAKAHELIRLFGNEWGVGDLAGGVGIRQK